MPELEEKCKKGMIIGERCRAFTLFYGFVAKKRVDDLCRTSLVGHTEIHGRHADGSANGPAPETIPSACKIASLPRIRVIAILEQFAVRSKLVPFFPIFYVNVLAADFMYTYHGSLGKNQ